MKTWILGSFLLLCSFLAFQISDAKVRVGSSPVMSSIGIYIAQSEGLFEEQGLEVEVIDFANSGAPMTLLLAKNELDVGGGNLTAGLFNAISQGSAIKLVADKGHVENNRDYIALVVRSDHLSSGRFLDFRNLRGFKLGLTALDGVSQQIASERFLQKGGLTEKDIEYIKLSYAEMNAALKSKSIDAAIQLEPFVTLAEEGGYAKRIHGVSLVHPHQQSAAILYSPQFAASRDKAVKFMKAYLKGVQIYNRSLKDESLRQKLFRSLGRRLKITDEKVWNKMTPVGLRDDGRLSVEALQEDLDWYRAKGFLKKEIKAKDIVDHTFVDEALKRINGN